MQDGLFCNVPLSLQSSHFLLVDPNLAFSSTYYPPFPKSGKTTSARVHLTGIDTRVLRPRLVVIRSIFLLLDRSPISGRRNHIILKPERTLDSSSLQSQPNPEAKESQCL